MKKYMVLFFLSMVFVFGVTAGAFAGQKWECQGPEYVCGPSKSTTRGNKKSPITDGVKNVKPTNVKRKLTLKKQIKTRSVYLSPKKKYPKPTGRIFFGLASYYWQPQRLATGGWFNPNAMTAAHKSLKFGTRVRVTNLRNKKSVVVKINDRGPYIRGRVIDLSKAAAGRIRMRAAGVVRVSVEILRG